MAESKEKHFHELLMSFKDGMLVTRTQEGELRGRPMMLAKVDRDDTIWFATSVHTGKAEEVLSDPNVNVALHDGKRSISVTGRGELVRRRRGRDARQDERADERTDDPNVAPHAGKTPRRRPPL